MRPRYSTTRGNGRSLLVAPVVFAIGQSRHPQRGSLRISPMFGSGLKPGRIRESPLPKRVVARIPPTAATGSLPSVAGVHAGEPEDSSWSTAAGLSRVLNGGSSFRDSETLPKPVDMLLRLRVYRRRTDDPQCGETWRTGPTRVLQQLAECLAHAISWCRRGLYFEQLIAFCEAKNDVRWSPGGRFPLACHLARPVHRHQSVIQSLLHLVVNVRDVRLFHRLPSTRSPTTGVGGRG